MCCLLCVVVFRCVGVAVCVCVPLLCYRVFVCLLCVGVCPCVLVCVCAVSSLFSSMLYYSLLCVSLLFGDVVVVVVVVVAPGDENDHANYGNCDVQTRVPFPGVGPCG